jgi:hypothetical protein
MAEVRWKGDIGHAARVRRDEERCGCGLQNMTAATIALADRVLAILASSVTGGSFFGIKSGARSPFLWSARYMWQAWWRIRCQTQTEQGTARRLLRSLDVN